MQTIRFHPIQKIYGVEGGMLLWNWVNLWADILLFLRGSPLASVSTQLCSVPRIQRETKDEKKKLRHSRKSKQRRDRAGNKQNDPDLKPQVLKLYKRQRM